MINATGPHTDFIRTMDNPDIKKICQPSSGVHIVLPDYYRFIIFLCCFSFTFKNRALYLQFFWSFPFNYNKNDEPLTIRYSPAKMGLLDPATSDGRVIFFLPWQNSTMAGTTDNPCVVSDNPQPSGKLVIILSDNLSS